MSKLSARKNMLFILQVEVLSFSGFIGAGGA